MIDVQSVLDRAADLESQLAAFAHSQPYHRPQDWHRAYWMLQFLDEIRPYNYACQYTPYRAQKLLRELEFWCNCAEPLAQTLTLSQKVSA